jgi:putative endonuclease
VARGRWGEERAARWYAAEGFTVLARNWRVRAGELDLVVSRDDLIVFVEVKSRANAAFGDPAAAVTPLKQRRLRMLAAQWLAENASRRLTVRFDVVCVLGNDVRVIEAAF